MLTENLEVNYTCHRMDIQEGVNQEDIGIEILI